jgi:hypothetical protein
MIKFTEEEIEFLKQNYNSMPVKEISKILNRNSGIIRAKACQLNLKNDIYYYSESDVEFLANNYSTMPIKKIAEELNKTVSSIRTKANKMGIQKVFWWSEQEIEVLKNVYPHYSNSKIAKDFLQNRTSSNINNMARKLMLKKSKDKGMKMFDIQDMISDLQKVAEVLGRTPLSTELVENNLPSEISYRRYFGSYTKACIKAGLTPNVCVFGHGRCTKPIASDGTKCDSKSEYIVSEYFISKNIPYLKGVRYSNYIDDDRCGLKTVDWIVGEYFVEFFGMPEKESYKKRMEEKLNLCNEYNIKLISLFKNDLYNLENKLHILSQ